MICDMAEPEPLEMLLSDAIRFLIAGGLQLEIGEKDDHQTYTVDGQDVGHVAHGGQADFTVEPGRVTKHSKVNTMVPATVR